jgi:amidohydrolase
MSFTHFAGSVESPVMTNFSNAVKGVTPEMIAVRRDVHAHPELGFQEKRTSKLIEAQLKKLGLKVRRVCGTGIIGTLQGAKPGKTLLLRADIDGLPVQELNDVPYKSQETGRMHACGHDGHIATALAAARLLAGMRSELKGNVKFMFQPAEEGPGGALPMIEEGLLDSPKVDLAFALHLWNELPVGQLGVRPGPVMAGAGAFRVIVIGKGGHGAAPEQTIDPVVVAAHVVTNLQSVVSRKISPVKPGIVTVGTIKGGTRYNIIPDSVTLEGTYRWFEDVNLKTLKTEIERVVKGVTQAHGATCKLEWTMDNEYPPTVNDADASRLVREAAASVVGTRNVVEQNQTCGAEDMAFVLRKVPGCYWMLGSANRKKGLDYPHHSARFDFDEDALPMGVETWVRLVQKVLC